MSETASISPAWLQNNQRFLSAALAVVRERLQPGEDMPLRISKAQENLALAQSNLAAAPSALDRVTFAFKLSPFERDLLLLCAGPELETKFAACIAQAHGDPRFVQPTFGLALSILPDPHWSALHPSAPLRSYGIIEVLPGGILINSPLRMDERVLHFLVGVNRPDQRLEGLLLPPPRPLHLPPSQQSIAQHIAAALTHSHQPGAPPIIELTGSESTEKQYIAWTACQSIGLSLLSISLSAMGSLDEMLLARLLAREAALEGCAIYMDCENDADNPTHTSIARRLAERLGTSLIIAAKDSLRCAHRESIQFSIHRPTSQEQRNLWRQALTPILGQEAPHTLINPLVAQFNMGAGSIQSVAGQATSGENAANALWNACRAHARPRLDDLAQRIEPSASLDDLILPPMQKAMLKQILVHVRQKNKVYEEWGFSSKGLRGLGVGALFAGASGTGKTMAAEVLAGELSLDLYRIDLSQVVSKYIGETEKNLRRVFDAAEEGAAILLFDEADALFGKRSEIKDSHDRYANIEVAYLLQRMESYRGLSILTTNLKNALDPAFIRRIRFIVHFPFPSAAERAEIWRRIFPNQTPTEGLDPTRLAKLNIAGGSIRNIAINAAFVAAQAGEPVRMPHILEAAQTEYVKLERTLTGTEVGGSP